MRADIHGGQERSAPPKGRIQKSKTSHCHSADSACNARPVHTVGSKVRVGASAAHVRFTPTGRRTTCPSGGAAARLSLPKSVNGLVPHCLGFRSIHICSAWQISPFQPVRPPLAQPLHAQCHGGTVGSRGRAVSHENKRERFRSALKADGHACGVRQHQGLGGRCSPTAFGSAGELLH
jgi:hypothetical protein